MTKSIVLINSGVGKKLVYTIYAHSIGKLFYYWPTKIALKTLKK